MDCYSFALCLVIFSVSLASIIEDRRQWLSEARCHAICLEQLGAKYDVELRHGSHDVYIGCGAACKECWKNCHVYAGNEKRCIAGCQKIKGGEVNTGACNRSCIAYADSEHLAIDSKCPLKAMSVRLICMNLVGEVHSPSVVALFDVNVTPEGLNLPLIYAVEFRKKLWNHLKNTFEITPWHPVGMQIKSLFSIQKLLSGDFYQIRSFIVSSVGPAETSVTSEWHQMLKGDAVLGPVTGISIKQYLKSPSDLRVIVSWKPNDKYPSCYYYLALMVNNTIRDRTFTIDGKFAYELNQLAFGSNYTVQIRSMSSKKTYGLESPAVSYSFKSISCLEANGFNYSICSPDMVRNLHLTVTNYTVTAVWEPPEHLNSPVNVNAKVNYVARLKSMIGVHGCIKQVKQEQSLSRNITSLSWKIPTDECSYSLYIATNSTAGLGPCAMATFDLRPLTPTSHLDDLSYLAFLPVILCIGGVPAAAWMWHRRRNDRANRDIAMNNLSERPSDATLEAGERKVKEQNLFASLEFEALLGEGAFGCVYKVKCKAPDLPNLVAVKTLKTFDGVEARNHLLVEIELLSKLPKHPHVTECLGYCAVDGLLMILLEFCSDGNLKQYLNKLYLERLNAERFEPLGADPPALYYGLQIAKGMEHLSAHNLVHRDLAARNVLVSNGGRTVKISDFGLSRMGRVYFQTSGARLPVRWMAPESIFHHIFTSKSDVWSFGIVLWEIVTMNLEPYPSMDLPELMQLLKSGYRMTKPKNCDQALYSIMVGCWNAKPGCRPSFTELRREISALLNLNKCHPALTNDIV